MGAGGGRGSAKDRRKGFEVGYELFCINGKMLGHGEPIRVKQGERVLFHIFNASAGEIRSLALPGHVFQRRGARWQSRADARRGAACSGLAPPNAFPRWSR